MWVWSPKPPTYINARGSIALPYKIERMEGEDVIERMEIGLVKFLDREQRVSKISLRWLFTLIMVNLPDASMELPEKHSTGEMPSFTM